MKEITIKLNIEKLIKILINNIKSDLRYVFEGIGNEIDEEIDKPYIKKSCEKVGFWKIFESKEFNNQLISLIQKQIQEDINDYDFAYYKPWDLAVDFIEKSKEAKLVIEDLAKNSKDFIIKKKDKERAKKLAALKKDLIELGFEIKKK